MSNEANEARVRTALDIALFAGALSLVATAFSVAEWADWLIEVNPIGGSPSGANPNIVGRQLQLLSLGAVVVAVSLLTLVVRARAAHERILAATLGALEAVAVLALVASHWQRGFYFHLAHAGPLAALILACVQCAALIIGARVERRG